MAPTPASPARTVWDVMRDTAQTLDLTLAEDRASSGEPLGAQYVRLRDEMLAHDPAADPRWTTLVQQLPVTVDPADAWPRLLAAMSARLIASDGADATGPNG